MAKSMVEANVAQVHNANGRVRAIRLTETVATHAVRIGPPSDPKLGGVRFTRWVRLDESSTRIIEHHPRAVD